jgi:anti-sigma factor RsiW
MQRDESENVMNCTTFKNRLDAVLDQRQSPAFDLQLAAHARHCRPCAQWLATQTAVVDHIDSSLAAELNADFALRVVELAGAERHRKRRRRQQWISVLAVAACLLLGFFSWQQSTRQEDITSLTTATHSTKIREAVRHRFDTVAEDFKPVTSSVYTAFNAIWLAQRML